MGLQVSVTVPLGPRPWHPGGQPRRISCPRNTAKIIWTGIDEAPALATFSLLPIVSAFTRAAGVVVETRDISVAGRIIAAFPDV